MFMKKISKFNVFVLLGIILATIAALLYWQYNIPKSGWKVIEGCVDYGSGEIDYHFYGLEEWELVTEDMGCGQTYETAQSFGLKDKDIGDRIDDITQVTVALYDSKPSSHEESFFTYHGVPGQDGTYLELGRISITTPTTSYKIDDTEWKYLKNSFKFK